MHHSFSGVLHIPETNILVEKKLYGQFYFKLAYK